ncbi:hypothetical protein Q5P01_012621 [Channa striata]|uniref:Secreted protein n=1 Tax=Channa striata TaxID=64152 RepID=A0AA88SKH9_CHASR|nr:hypothetical protein Q5P01_012621 [Channa striata]
MQRASVVKLRYCTIAISLLRPLAATLVFRHTAGSDSHGSTSDRWPPRLRPRADDAAASSEEHRFFYVTLEHDEAESA